MTRSMSYRRYFMIATAMATHRAVSATWNRTSSQGVEKKLLGTKTAPTRVAERTKANQNTAATTADGLGPDSFVNGRDHCADAWISENTVSNTVPAPAAHATGRHRREGSRPFGNSRRRNASPPIGIPHVQ